MSHAEAVVAHADPVIDSVVASAYTIPTDQPEADGTFEWTATTVLVVEATAGGRRGLGWSYTSSAAVAVVTDMLASVVCGRDALDVPAVHEDMARAVRNVGRQGIAATAISAVDVALWDLKARLLDLPLCHLLGRMRDVVPIYGSGGFTTYDDATTRAQLEDFVGRCGAQAVKIKIGESWGHNEARDLSRTALARDVIGPDRALFVDANGGYDVGQAVRVGRRLDGLGVSWFEEPVSSNDLAGLAAVRLALDTDVAAGEYGYDVGYFRRMLTAGAVDCLQIDITRCGGVTDFLAAAAVAASYEIDVSGHCAPHLHAHVAAAIPHFRHLEYFHDHARIEETLLFSGACAVTDGVLRPRLDVIGHGMELKKSDASEFRVA